jgi:hypothetical protein
VSDSQPPSWKEMLSVARSVPEVLAIARDYQDRLEPWQLFELPSACKPRELRSAAELGAYAYDLKRNSCSLKETAAADAEQLAYFFAEAALRVTLLTGPHGSHPLPEEWKVSL